MPNNHDCKIKEVPIGTFTDLPKLDIEQYKKNPVLLLNHNKDTASVLGIVQNLHFEGNGTMIADILPSEPVELNRKLLESNMFALEYIPIDYEDTEQVCPDGKSRTVRVIKKAELCSISLTTIPKETRHVSGKISGLKDFLSSMVQKIKSKIIAYFKKYRIK